MLPENHSWVCRRRRSEPRRSSAGLCERLRSAGRPEEAEIFEAQAMMAADPELLDAAAVAGGPGNGRRCGDPGRR